MSNPVYEHYRAFFLLSTRQTVPPLSDMNSSNGDTSRESYCILSDGVIQSHTRFAAGCYQQHAPGSAHAQHGIFVM